MKKLRGALSLLLVLTMVFTVACIPALAANPYNIRTYVAFGDSIATGMNEEKGPNKYPTGELDENGEPVLEEGLGSNGNGYTDCVARALELEAGNGYYSYGHTGLRTNELLYFLDPSVSTEGLILDRGLDALFADAREEMLQHVREADLITLNIGENDVFTIPMVIAVIAALVAASEDAGEQAQLADAAEAAENAETPEDALAGVTNALKTTDLLNKFVAAFIPLAIAGYQTFKQNLPEILGKLRELNPNAQIVVLGVFNPLVARMNSDIISTLDGLDAIVTPMNLFMAATCLKYGCTFVPMTDVQIDSTVHPSNAQYQKMADRIVASLKTQTTFTDVSSLSNEFKTAINWAVQTGVTEGTFATTFSPNDNCTRAQIVTFLWRMAGEPEPTQAAVFDDLTEGWYAKSVAWAAENGITNGTSETKFSPYDICTRAQIVTFLYRYDQKFNPDAKQSTASASFRDVSLGAYYGAPVAWAVQNGITKGISSVLFAPMQSCTRAQAVTFLYRYSML